MTEPDEEDIAPTRGCLNGVLGGAIFWLFVASVIVATWLTVR